MGLSIIYTSGREIDLINKKEEGSNPLQKGEDNVN